MNLTDTPRLSEQDEIDLAKRIEAGVYASHLVREQPGSTVSGQAHRDELLQVVRDGQEAWDHFFTANMPLVIHIAASWCLGAQVLSMEDRIQQGSVALLKAMAAWDYTRGVPFGAFARRHIDAATRPAYALPEVPLPAELPQPSLASTPSSSDGSECHVDVLHAAWLHMAAWQRQVLSLRFGLGGEEPFSYARMAERLGVSYREARRLERSALGTLQECSLAEGYAYAAV